jgi:5-formyltetrahydrofolate cyclo-ligase
MPDAVVPNKAALRAVVLRRREALSASLRATHSARIAERVEPILRATRPQTLGAYAAFGSEADPAAIAAVAESWGTAVALPAMIDQVDMVFRLHRSGEPLVPDAFRIRGPAPNAPVVEPDLLVVPITAFDRTGARLGKGRGVYDRAIARFRARGHRPLLVGIAFSVQEVPAIPREPHDVPLDWIVTETEALRCAQPV